jgi:hypothetical protein
MRICIDSCVFIQGLGQSDPAAVRLLDVVGPELILLIPRLAAQEVIRNLATSEQASHFYRLFQARDFAFIDEPVPPPLVDKYVKMGLPEKTDALIGAFAEWMQVRYLISDNRHFLRNLRTDAYEVLDATGFIERWETNTL